ncbi:MAG: FAD-binding oxidoreductase [Thaumarchaeota archaeon]|nr:FAD-binding oxidoreductase [Nitrososphaerota archaeon]
MRREVVRQFQALLGNSNVINGHAGLERYPDGTYEAVWPMTRHWRFGTEFGARYFPALVLRPASTRQVAQILKTANRNKVPVIPLSGGTNLVGATVPLHEDDAVILDMRRMNKIKGIDDRYLSAVVEPALTLAGLQDALNRHGLCHGILPGSAEWATVGGSICMDAHTKCGFKYGTVSENLLELEVVTPEGGVVRTGPWFGAGYNLRQLFVGSEGSLGVITEVTMKVHREPEVRFNTCYAFKTFGDAVKAQQEIWFTEMPAVSTVLAYDERLPFDYKGFRDAPGGKSGEGWVITGLEGSKIDVAEAKVQAARIVRSNHGRTYSAGHIPPEEDLMLFLSSKEKVTSKSDGGKASSGPFIVSRHVWIPPGEVVRVRDSIKKTVLDHGQRYAGSISSPDRLNPAFLTDLDDAAQLRATSQILEEIGVVVHKAGGTMLAAHGVGLANKAVFRGEREQAALELMRRVKRAMDPLGLMNPHKFLD